MYIRRAIVDEVGALDEAAFPRGYGEENDFCQRASARGYRHLIAGNVYVRHERSASFGHERRAQLGEAAWPVLRERWPNYERDVGATLFSFERRVLDWRVRRIFASADARSPRLRVLVAGAANAEPVPQDDAELSHWLQARAFDAIVAEGARSDALSRLAPRVGIPFGTAKPGEDTEVCAQRAIASARTFREDTR